METQWPKPMVCAVIGHDVFSFPNLITPTVQINKFIHFLLLLTQKDLETSYTILLLLYFFATGQAKYKEMFSLTFLFLYLPKLVITYAMLHGNVGTFGTITVCSIFFHYVGRLWLCKKHHISKCGFAKCQQSYNHRPKLL